MEDAIIRKFVDAVADMRTAQNEYFRTKGHGALEMAKRLEKKVDKLLRQPADVFLVFIGWPVLIVANHKRLDE